MGFEMGGLERIAFARPSCDFVSDGRRRHETAVAAEIRAAVQAAFAERMAQASPLRRVWLRMAMRREIRRRIRLAPMASPEALYLRSKPARHRDDAG
jgi:hypothetical protein